MEIRIQFQGGPLDDERATIDRLDPALFFTDSPHRTILVYVRENEVLYVYDPIKTMGKSHDFEATRMAMEGQSWPLIRFLSKNDSEDLSGSDLQNDGK